MKIPLFLLGSAIGATGALDKHFTKKGEVKCEVILREK